MSPQTLQLITWLSWLEEEPGWEKKDDPGRPDEEIINQIFSEGHIPISHSGVALRALRFALREKGHTAISASDLLTRLRAKKP